MLKAFVETPFLLSIPIVVFVAVRAKTFYRVSFWITVLVLCLSYMLAAKSIVSPVEILHIALYGVLGILIYSVLKFKVKGFLLFVWTGILTATVGCVDEGIQYLLPNRHFDWNDILINSLGGLMALITIRYIFGDRGL